MFSGYDIKDLHSDSRSVLFLKICCIIGCSDSDFSLCSFGHFWDSFLKITVLSWILKYLFLENRPILFVPSSHPAVRTASLNHLTNKKSLSADAWFIYLTADSVVDISSLHSNVRLLSGSSDSFRCELVHDFMQATQYTLKASNRFSLQRKSPRLKELDVSLTFLNQRVPCIL